MQWTNWKFKLWNVKIPWQQWWWSAQTGTKFVGRKLLNKVLQRNRMQFITSRIKIHFEFKTSILRIGCGTVEREVTSNTTGPGFELKFCLAVHRLYSKGTFSITVLNKVKNTGCRHSSVDSYVPSIIPPQFESQAHHLCFLNFYLSCVMWKRRK